MEMLIIGVFPIFSGDFRDVRGPVREAFSFHPAYLLIW